MSNKSVDDLRNMLFEVIAGVRDGSVTLDKAKVVAELSQVVVNSAKAEVDFVRAAGGKAVATGFLGRQTPEGDTPGDDRKKDANGNPLPAGITGVTQHRLT